MSTVAYETTALGVSSPPQDWDAIFSNLESAHNENKAQSSADLGKSVFDSLDKEEAASSAPQAQQMPQLGRALSSGTEHDDPILKKLTGMGYPRSDALAALEKFDYDISKVNATHPPSHQEN
jgi:epidermal growth factor receptor substrate 15